MSGRADRRGGRFGVASPPPETDDHDENHAYVPIIFLFFFPLVKHLLSWFLNAGLCRFRISMFWTAGLDSVLSKSHQGQPLRPCGWNWKRFLEQHYKPITLTLQDIEFDAQKTMHSLCSYLLRSRWRIWIFPTSESDSMQTGSPLRGEVWGLESSIQLETWGCSLFTRCCS